MVESGPRIGGGVPVVRDHSRRDRTAAAFRPQAGFAMTRAAGESRANMLAINAALVLLALVALAPLMWMLSVSFMPAGAVSHFPPPLLPSRFTLDNYRELFVRIGIGHYLVNSVIVASAITVLSLLVNTMAGYAF